MSKKNYLNKRDLLLEIIKSKNTYSEFLSKEYEMFDVIINDLSEITQEVIEEAKQKRIEEKYSQERAAIRERGGTQTEISKVVRDDISTINDEDIVFRYMTYEHIPENLDRVKKKKAPQDYKEKVPFPAFKHVILKDGEIKEVGRSHWAGGFHNGYFSIDHGNFTVKLCAMMKLLVEKYSQKGNFRGYCVDKETSALTNRGWLTQDQITEQDMILSVNMNNGSYEWGKIKSIYRGNYDTKTNPKMFRLTNDSNTIDQMITPNHKLLIQTDNGFELKKIDDINNKDQVIFSSSINYNRGISFDSFSNKIVEELISVKNNTLIDIQDAFNKIHLLSGDEKYFIACEMKKFVISSSIEISQTNIDWISYILCIFGFNTKQVDDTLQIVYQDKQILNGESKLKSRFNPFKNKGTEEYNDIVWCPETEFGNFVSRRNGTISITSNTYNDEMRSRAIFQLLTVGLQFNEAKSDNPFAYYTRIAQHAFIGVLNAEKKAQSIRDDILIKMGVTPSFSRQVEYEMEYKQKEFNERNNIQESEVVMLKATPQRGKKKQGN